jgi:hypothetical protein
MTTIEVSVAEPDIQAVFARAKEIDPEAWGNWMPARFQNRRSESFKMAYTELKPPSAA